jgi:hypothetical protein
MGNASITPVAPALQHKSRLFPAYIFRKDFAPQQSQFCF